MQIYDTYLIYANIYHKKVTYYEYMPYLYIFEYSKCSHLI